MPILNPIPSLGGVATPAPSKYEVSLSDISLPGAGRALDGTMYKQSVGKKYHIDLEYAGLSYEEGRKVLQSTNAEFFPVTFLGMDGTMLTRTFYRSDIKATFIGHGLDRWHPISFSIIER